MAGKQTTRGAERGFTLSEFVVVIAAACILLAMAVPVATTVMDQYRARLAAQGIVSQLQFARMKAVASNESFEVNFPANSNSYQVETSSGSVISGPFYLGRGVSWNTTDPGGEVSFPGRRVIFSPTGNIPTSGVGSAGRAKIVSQTGIRIDVVVGSGGMIRQTTPYKQPPAPF